MYTHIRLCRAPDDIEIIRANSVRRTKKGGTGPIIGGKELDWLALKAYSARKTWAFTPATQVKINCRTQQLDIQLLNAADQMIHSLKMAPTRPLCGIHIRRGDKIGGEAAEVFLPKYLDAFQEMNVSCQSYFLASDAIGNIRKQIIGELQQRQPSALKMPLIVTLNYTQGDPYDEGGYRWASFLSKDEASRIGNTIDFLAEVEVSNVYFWRGAKPEVADLNHVCAYAITVQVMRAVDAFAGAYSSNVARLVMVLRAATGWGPETSKSVEGQEWDWLWWKIKSIYPSCKMRKVIVRYFQVTKY